MSDLLKQHGFIKKKEIFFSPQTLHKKLEEFSKKKIDLTLKKNRSTYIALREKRKKRVKLTLHLFFLQANEDLLKDLVKYLFENDKEAKKNVRTFAEKCYEKEKYFHSVSNKQIYTKGKIYDLKKLYGEIDKQYFQGKIKASITYFSMPLYKKGRHCTFGSYDSRLKLIRINEMLDSSFFPFYFVSFVIYHEMLHEVFPAKITKSGRRQIHGRDFREKEKEFFFYSQAKEWEKNFLKRDFRKIVRGLHGRT